MTEQDARDTIRAIKLFLGIPDVQMLRLNDGMEWRVLYRDANLKKIILVEKPAFVDRLNNNIKRMEKTSGI